MILEFTKMNGAGNDFVLVDNRAQKIRLTPEQIIRLCDRHRGVGADGVMLLVPARTGQADWAWDFYNSDGSAGGNVRQRRALLWPFRAKGNRRESRFQLRDGGGDHHRQFSGRAGDGESHSAEGVATESNGAARGGPGDDPLAQHRRAPCRALRAGRGPGDGACNSARRSAATPISAPAGRT